MVMEIIGDILNFEMVKCLGGCNSFWPSPALTKDYICPDCNVGMRR